MPKNSNLPLDEHGSYKNNIGLFHFIANYLLDAIISVDMTGKIAFWNKAAEKMFKYAAEEIIGKPLTQIMPEWSDIKQMQTGEFAIIKNTFRGETFETVGIRKGGSAFSVEVNYSVLNLGNKTYLSFIVRDITEKKKMEKELRESEEKYRNIFENASDIIAVLDLKGKILELNKAAEKYGLKREEIIGLNVRDLIQQDFWQKILKDLKLAKQGKPVKSEVEIVTPKVRIFVEYNSNPIKIGDKVVGIQVIARDITQRKQSEKIFRELHESIKQELKETQAKLVQSERLAAIGELAQMVAHDIRNPLMGIAGAVYYLKTRLEPKLDDTETKMLKIIEENLRYTDKIVSDLQEYSREIKLRLRMANVKVLLKKALTLVHVPENIQVIDKTCKSHKMKVDPDKVVRVFVNVIKNAVEAMPEGGKLTVKSRKMQNYIEISFIDTGVGVPKEKLENIGKPLFTTKAKGMGFGLAICNRIMEAHEGKLVIESSVGKKTTVTLRFPYPQKTKIKQEVISEALQTFATKINA